MDFALRGFRSSMVILNKEPMALLDKIDLDRVRDKVKLCLWS